MLLIVNGYFFICFPLLSFFANFAILQYGGMKEDDGARRRGDNRGWGGGEESGGRGGGRREVG